MSDRTTDGWIAHLQQHSVTVHDWRGQLPKHRTRRWQRRDVARLVGVCWHHSAGSRTNEHAFASIAHYHVGPSHLSKTGAPGIAYTAGVTAAGHLYVFHDLDAMTWSQRKANATHIGIVLLGSFRSADNLHPTGPTRSQVWACRKISVETREYLRAHEKPLWVAVHSDFSDTACPGDEIRRLVVHQMRGERVPFSGVRQRQQALADLGGMLHVDGVWGPESRRALEAFQVNAGLRADGLWGPLTEAAIVRALEARYTEAVS